MSIEATAEENQAAGVTPNPPWRVRAASVLPDYLPVVTFQDGTSGVADLSSELTARECGICEPLKDSAFFEQAGVERGVITWPNAADLDPVWMYEALNKSRTWSAPI